MKPFLKNEPSKTNQKTQKKEKGKGGWTGVIRTTQDTGEKP